MNLNLIKIFAIVIVVICCLIATYTDVKRQEIPNKLTFSIFTIGIFLTSLYFYLINDFRIFYYFSIVFVYLFSYIIWYFGVWAGGDVKLFTALATLFIPEFLDIVPIYPIYNMLLPFNLLSFDVPIVLLIFNSILAIMPMILIMIICIIIKNKSYLIDDLVKCIDFKDIFLSLNSFLLTFIIFSILNVYSMILKMILLIFLPFIFSRILKNKYVLILISFITFSYQIYTNNLMIYLNELFFITLLVICINIYQKGIIKEVLTDNLVKNKLSEGMILAYPLYKSENNYYFDKSNLFKTILNQASKGKLICETKAAGVSKLDIELINSIDEINYIPIKKALPFAPFILGGLILTLTLGNTFDLFIIFLEMI